MNASTEDSEDRHRGKMRFNGLSLVKYLQRIRWVKDRYTKWVHIKSVSANAVVNHNERLNVWKTITVWKDGSKYSRCRDVTLEAHGTEKARGKF